VLFPATLAACLGTLATIPAALSKSAFEYVFTFSAYISIACQSHSFVAHRSFFIIIVRFLSVCVQHRLCCALAISRRANTVFARALAVCARRVVAAPQRQC